MPMKALAAIHPIGFARLMDGASDGDCPQSKTVCSFMATPGSESQRTLPQPMRRNARLRSTAHRNISPCALRITARSAYIDSCIHIPNVRRHTRLRHSLSAHRLTDLEPSISRNPPTVSPSVRNATLFSLPF